MCCSLSDRHQIIAKSLSNHFNHIIIVAGTGSAGATSTTLSNPLGTFVNTSLVFYVADYENHCIIRFGTNVFQCLIGCQNSNELNYPWSISFDSFENLFVVDRGNRRIRRFEVIDGRNYSQNSNGYYTGIVSGNYTMLNEYGNLMTIQSLNNRSFTLLSAVATAAYD
ncbi:unnamed protein product [Adineta ricciae]|uniref:Uncharacterized protein n=1 Tax=Adineta ricciae TaxID=249248 RepID=A0A815RJ32_ADIRI|nr:unnamed protein product [Adineta ricciae]CAF1629368.1 unnamed protein product [Adineta ricciae]